MTKIKDYLIYILALFPLFNFQLVNLSIALFIVACGVNFNINTINWPDKNTVVKVVCLSLPFLLSIVSLIWTNNIDQGISFVERALPIIIFPLFTFLFKPFSSKDVITKFFKTYIISNAVLALIIFGYAIVNALYISESSVRVAYGTYLRSRLETIPIIGEHPIYLSLLMGSALLFLFYSRFKNTWLNITLGTLFLIVFFLSNSRGPMLALLVSISVMLIFKKVNVRYKVWAFTTLILTVSILFVITPLKSRLMELINTKHNYPIGQYYNSYNIRLGIYKCSYIITEKIEWYGLGPGDVQFALDECYDEQFKTSAYKTGIFNTHNQYLFYWLSYGIFGLLIILITYVFFYSNAFKSDNKLYIVFLTFMFTCFLFENILSRNTGIMLFSIFNTLFLFQVNLDKVKRAK
ncbi:MAG: O-antigen ligase family protein [Maribacter dokdonensis]|uniref:O-antigen ligase family protein n=1 Tax=Maribacter dokdonensis TaxID=320912 RepID=UPI003297507A